MPEEIICKKCHTVKKSDPCEGCNETKVFKIPTLNEELLKGFTIISNDINLKNTNSVAQLMRRVVSGEITLKREVKG